MFGTLQYVCGLIRGDMKMKKLVVTLLGATLLVSGCGTETQKEDQTSQQNQESAQSKQDKQEHKKKEVDGVTYIDDILIVNKKVTLPSTYNPGVNPKAQQAMQQLLKDGNAKGLNMSVGSGFRSYQEQEQLFNSYVERDGKEKAMTYSAVPGQSEHQTGLAFDVVSDNTDTNFTEAFGKTDAGKWLAQHAHEYGFIIRYPKGQSDVTGYQYEPWHLRYVGVDTATDIHDSHQTLEAYVGLDTKSKDKD